MSFKSEELKTTALELRTELQRILSAAPKKKKEPDIFLGSHPAVLLSSRLQAIAIWHGLRIDHHFGEWVNRMPQWTAHTHVSVTLNQQKREIDNLLVNKSLDLVLAVETKRIWNNQDSGVRIAIRTIQNNFSIRINPPF